MLRAGPKALSAALLALLAALVLAACGDDESSESGEGAQPAPEASAFPAADGRSLDELLAEGTPDQELVVSPANQVFTEGTNRLGFGVFTVEREQITDAEVAIYAEPAQGGGAEGPFPARIESLETEPEFTAKTTADDPDAAKVVYVTELELDQPGEWRLVALVRQGEELQAVRLPSVVVRPNDPIPAPGDRAPRVETPTFEDVGGNVEEIDTRVPPSSMHDEDLAEVLGEKPVVLLFATPALCQSRVCGPVVDVAEQVKAEQGDGIAFIHQEIYEDNDPSKGVRPPVAAFNLPTEPWLFVIDRDGRVDTRIEGAFSVAELEQAVERVSG